MTYIATCRHDEIGFGVKVPAGVQGLFTVPDRMLSNTLNREAVLIMPC
jgi:hypothetical protein